MPADSPTVDAWLGGLEYEKGSGRPEGGAAAGTKPVLVPETPDKEDEVAERLCVHPGLTASLTCLPLWHMQVHLQGDVTSLSKSTAKTLKRGAEEQMRSSAGPGAAPSDDESPVACSTALHFATSLSVPLLRVALLSPWQEITSGG